MSELSSAPANVNELIDRLKTEDISAAYVQVQRNDTEGFFRVITLEDEMEEHRTEMLLIGLEKARACLQSRIDEIRKKRFLNGN